MEINCCLYYSAQLILILLYLQNNILHYTVYTFIPFAGWIYICQRVNEFSVSTPDDCSNNCMKRFVE